MSILGKMQANRSRAKICFRASRQKGKGGEVNSEHLFHFEKKESSE